MIRRLRQDFQYIFRSAPIRSALIALSVLMLVAALFSIHIGRQVNQLLADQTLEMLRGELRDLRSELDRGGLVALSAAVAERSAQPGRGLYRLESTKAKGAPAVGNLSARPDDVSQFGGIFKVRDANSGEMHTAVGIEVPVRSDTSLIVARNFDDQRAFAVNLQRLTFGGIGLIALLALGAGWWESRRLNLRVAGVSATAKSIMDGDFKQRIPSDGSGDEFDELASSLNAMLGRIEDLMHALREVSDNIAHDLKTPLTRLRSRAEAALREGNPSTHHEALERVIEEADNLIQTFNSLLLIARLEAGAVDATRVECDLYELVRDVAELYEPVADDVGLSLAFEATSPAPAFVNRQLVGQAVANMIDNSIKYSHGAEHGRESSVTIGVELRPSAGVEISVSDRGPGIPASDRERAMKRFVRLEQSRSRPGTGLGLSLVAAVARLHGGNVRLEDNAPGLRIVLTLPQTTGDTSVMPGSGGTSIAAHAEAIAR